MRVVLLIFVVAISLFSLRLSIPALGSAVERVIGNRAVELLLVSESPSQHGIERALRTRERSLSWAEHRKAHLEIGIAYLDLTRRVRASMGKASLVEKAQASIEASLSLSPVQPLAWLLLARIDVERDDRFSVADNLRWSLRTGHFIAEHALERTVLGLMVWSLLDEATVERLMDSVAHTVARDPSIVARLAVDAFVEEEIAARLVAMPAEGAHLWQQYAQAIYEHTGHILLPLTY